MIDTNFWKITKGNPSEHLVWLENPKGVKAVFKQPRDSSAFKLIEIANELIVYKLAKETGIPVSQTYLDYLDGRIGIVSIIQAEINWNIVTSQNLQNQVVNMDLLRQLFAFDVFVINTDRSTGKSEHVIVNHNSSGYSFYAIDHGHTLNGCTHGEVKWNLENVGDRTKFPINNMNHLSEPQIHGFVELESMIRRIEDLEDGTIDNIMEETYLLVSQGRPQEEQQSLRTNCDVIKKLLKISRDNLRNSIKEWCMAKGRPIN